jgi:hypothetical protein
MKPTRLTRLLAVSFVFLSLQASQAAVLFRDDFNDGNADGWEETGNPWTVVGGAYDQNLSGYDLLAISTAGDEAWTNYALQVDAISLAGPQKDCVVRFQPETGSYYAATIRSEPWGNDVYVTRVLNGNDVPLSSAYYPTQTGTWYTMRVEVCNENIKVFVKEKGAADFDLLIDCHDPSITHGRAGVAAWTGAAAVAHVRYDNVLIETLPGCTEPSWSAGTSAEASAYGPSSERKSTAVNHLCLVFIPVGATVALHLLRRRRLPPRRSLDPRPGLPRGYPDRLQHRPGMDRRVPLAERHWGAGLLAHGALPAREYRIPAVMVIPGSTQRFRDDEVLEPDAAAGTIQRRW